MRLLESEQPEIDSTDARYNPRDPWDEHLSTGRDGPSSMVIHVNPVAQNANAYANNLIDSVTDFPVQDPSVYTQ
jgi:hypothetical protein